MGISDDSMSQATENKKPSKQVVSLIVEQGSKSSGDTVFYEDPTVQVQEMSRAAASSDQPTLPTTAQQMQVVPAMPEEVKKEPPTQVVQPAMVAPTQVATPVLPFTRNNPVKRSGSDDIEGERPARMRTPSPKSSLPPRPSRPQLSQVSQEERVPAGSVRRQVAERDMLQLQQQHLNASSVCDRRTTR